MPLLFSYGTLQQEAVQRATFGHRLRGEPDELLGLDPAFVAASGKADHAIVRELVMADACEPAGYTRVSARLASGRQAWVYAAAPGT
jgi:hypothetical protein